MAEMSESVASRISLAIHGVAGFVAGYLWVYLQNGLYLLGAAIAILLVTGFVAEKAVNRKGIKWWMANGGVLFIIVWIVTWVYLFNL